MFAAGWGMFLLNYDALVGLGGLVVLQGQAYQQDDE